MEHDIEFELRSVTADSDDIAAFEEINREAIPEEERNSLEDLFATGADGNLEINGIYVGGKPLGFLVLRKYKSIRYLAYLAVRFDIRSHGVGSMALTELVRRYPDCQTVVEYEAPEKDITYVTQRHRRRSFYIRNGFRPTGWYTFYDGVEFEIACAGEDFDAREFGEFIDYLGTIVSDHIPHPYRKDI